LLLPALALAKLQATVLINVVMHVIPAVQVLDGGDIYVAATDKAHKIQLIYTAHQAATEQLPAAAAA
jgi:nitroimidazol reductase NimA-like FMN-containing flavoprotein (pyridoxamine 5'-phosphate oxidase superfamily)